MVKQCFLDLETTGTDFMKNGIYQIGGIIRYQNVLQKFQFNCDIFLEDEIDDKAFEITKVKPEDLSTFSDPHETYKELINILSAHVDKFNPKDKLFFINFGAEFDSKFLRRWFESNGDQYFGSWFWHPPVEVQSLAMEAAKEKRHLMKNFKLSTVCKELGIEFDDTQSHTALYDAERAMLLYDECTKT